ncbi:hypothetical protein [Jeotgalibacillus campisalis]|uniref:Uncharacterized protein n=1 Tax=Jeotgalibacillus campisalis TaxID=220754 RepID=A0A0C2SEV3_9BACL|nr:hypothetical protein [Jeotgalibacillus campisalis]KIL52469.1 hypothetical protein KR50_05970 [Jeotgalibacillus campisalis]
MNADAITDLVAIVMSLSIPIVIIIGYYSQRQSVIKKSIVEGEIELEKLRQENYLLETEKLKIELDHRNLPQSISTK